MGEDKDMETYVLMHVDKDGTVTWRTEIEGVGETVWQPWESKAIHLSMERTAKLMGAYLYHLKPGERLSVKRMS